LLKIGDTRGDRPAAIGQLCAATRTFVCRLRASQVWKAISGRTVRQVVCAFGGKQTVRKSILEAIRDGEWDYEPEQVAETRFDPTGAMPGTREKLSVLANRVQAGLPLWHGNDRTEYDDEA
jgi:hypothetical protein